MTTREISSLNSNLRTTSETPSKEIGLTGMTILRPTDEDNISDEGIIHDEVIRNNEESIITDEGRGSFNAVNQ